MTSHVVQSPAMAKPGFRPSPGMHLQRKCDCGAHLPGGGFCESCANNSKRVQREHRIAPTSDPLEQEADRVAEQILSGSATAGIDAGPVRVQRLTSNAPEQCDYAPASVENVLATAGHPLDAGTRHDMEQRFGHDFSAVRIHLDGAAQQSAYEVGAQAYTVGHDIVFGTGRFSPSAQPGRHLLAHELAHVVQQSGAAPGPTLMRAPDASRGGGRSPSHGGVLPYREATELAKCVGIMGDEEYCREEVLGEAVPSKCAKTHTIPDTIHAAIGVAWGKSKHGEARVIEQGGRIVNDKTGQQQIRTGSGSGGSISLPAALAGDTTTGTFHTHPYSIREGSELGVAFSGGDIENFVAGSQGGVKYIGAGSCYFALDTLNYVERAACKKVKIKERWNQAFARGTGTFQEKVQQAVKAAIVGCGLCFYKICRPDDTSPVPKVADEV